MSDPSIRVRKNGFTGRFEARFTLHLNGKEHTQAWLDAPSQADGLTWAKDRIAELQAAVPAKPVVSVPEPVRAPQPLPFVRLYTDGSNIGQPGPGGWGALLEANGREPIELSGSIERATNNIAELMAVIQGLKALKRPCRVLVVSDSQYVVKGINHWLNNWVRRNWVNGQNEPVANQALWAELHELKQVHTLTAKWVKGHAGHAQNERVDALAKAAARAEQARQRETGAFAPERELVSKPEKKEKNHV